MRLLNNPVLMLFANLDADRRLRTLNTEQSPAPELRPRPPEIATASLPKADRRLIRSKAMSGRIFAAARSRAPKFNTRHAQSDRRPNRDPANRILTP